MKADSCDSAKCLIYKGKPSFPLAISLYFSKFLSFEPHLARELEVSILETSNFLFKNIDRSEFKNEVSTLKKKMFLRLK